MSKSNEIVHVVVDNGHFNLKGVFLDSQQEIPRFIMPTMVMLGYGNAMNFSSEGNLDFKTKRNTHGEEVNSDEEMHFNVVLFAKGNDILNMWIEIILKSKGKRLHIQHPILKRYKTFLLEKLRLFPQ